MTGKNPRTKLLAAIQLGYNNCPHLFFLMMSHS